MLIKDSPNFKTKSKPFTFSPNTKVQDAIEIMCKNNIGSILVINKDETLAGIVTERDMMIRILGQKLNPENTLLSQIMSKNVKTAKEDDDLIDWLQTMSNQRFRHLPIVDSNGKVINMMSQGDFVAHTWPDLHETFRINLNNKFSKMLQILLIVFAIITLGLIAFKM